MLVGDWCSQASCTDRALVWTNQWRYPGWYGEPQQLYSNTRKYKLWIRLKEWRTESRGSRSLRSRLLLYYLKTVRQINTSQLYNKHIVGESQIRALVFPCFLHIATQVCHWINISWQLDSQIPGDYNSLCVLFWKRMLMLLSFPVFF